MTTYNTYKDYLCDPETGTASWHIEFISAPNAKALETMHHLARVIMKQWTNQTLESAKEPSAYCSGKVWDGEKFL